MPLSRREMIELLGVSAVTGFAWSSAEAHIQQSGAAPRLPLEEFVQSERLVAAFRKGVREMQRRKPSDPLSWFYQAAIHAVTPEAVMKAAAEDPGVDGVFQKRWWNQCPHFGENSANFLPWHRGYTFYFEKILRLHAEESDFSLPYWNYTRKECRQFPREFGVQHLDGNLENSAPENINPLYLAERDYYFAGYEHPFAMGLPLLELTDSAVDVTLPMNAPVFFGDTEREGLGGGIVDEDASTRGLLESYPHDHIHRAVGGIIDSSTGELTVGAMATPPTAAFDPIFWVHHSNIDRLWAEWACKPGKQWGTSFPPDYWFNERAWFFRDVDGSVVNEPRKKFFDHRTMGIRFKYEDPGCLPLTLPKIGPQAPEAIPSQIKHVERLVETGTPFTVPVAQRAAVPVAKAGLERLRAPFNAVRAQALPDHDRRRIILRLQNVRLGTVAATGFDVHLSSNPKANFVRTDKSFVGSIGLFGHAHGDDGKHAQAHGGGKEGTAESFDVSAAAAAVDPGRLDRLEVVFVPYSLLAVPGKDTVILSRAELRVGGMEFLMIE